MNKVEQKLAKLLKVTFEAEGFELRKNWDSFIRETEYGFDKFHISDQGKHYDNVVTIGCVFGVRHDQIQNLFNTFGFVYGEDAQQQSVTFALQYPFIPWQSRNTNLKIHMETKEDDINVVAKALAAAFKDHALPFYQKFSQIGAIEEMLNNPSLDVEYYSTGSLVPEQVAVVSLLCAKAANPGRYNLVRDDFIKLEQGMYSLEKRMGILEKVDKLKII